MIDTALPPHVLYGTRLGDAVVEKHPYPIYTKYMKTMMGASTPRRRAFYSYQNILLFSCLLALYGDNMEGKMDICLQYNDIQVDVHRVLSELHT
jgi:hypothetical protein